MPGAGNLISGNMDGLFIAGSGSNNNEVAGNRIGTDVTGTKALGNGNLGVAVSDAPNNWVGGADIYYQGQFYHQGNVISGNGFNALVIQGATNTTVEDNKIGADVTGTKALGNGLNGVALSSASYNLIGGTGLGAGNVIAANGGNGVEIDGSSSGNSIQNQVQGNWIGTGKSGQLHLGNHQNGVYLYSDPSATAASYGNQIGGADTTGPVDAGVGNTIAFNTLAGVCIRGALMVSNPVRGNAIYGNGGPGIDTQDWPAQFVQLLSANSATNTVTFEVVNPTSTWRVVVVDFYASGPGDAPAGQVQGRTYLGRFTFNVPPGWAGAFTVSLAKTFAKGQVLSATLTDYYYSTTGGFSNSVVAF
jgi:hypothetical protein